MKYGDGCLCRGCLLALFQRRCRCFGCDCCWIVGAVGGLTLPVLGGHCCRCWRGKDAHETGVVARNAAAVGAAVEVSAVGLNHARNWVSHCSSFVWRLAPS